MTNSTINNVREAWLAFFEARGHTRMPSDSLVPENDPSLLFTGAGMNQFKDEFLGRGKRGLRRATTSQKCLRMGDLDSVGRTYGHHSMFEMLGNFSFGDYFKLEAIHWAWEFLTCVLRIDGTRLHVTVYQEDHEAYAVWRNEIGLPDARIHRLGAKGNFWPSNAPADGPNGPCGPCSEIFYDWGPAYDAGQDNPGQDGARFVEVWNLVFTQFDRQEGGKLVPLPQRNIDTGAGLERLVAVLEGVHKTLNTSIFAGLRNAIAEASGRTFYDGASEDAVRIRRIADHVRAACFLVGDDVWPGNEGRGYVLRRLIRRAVRDGAALGIKKPFLGVLVPCVVDAMGEAYPELVRASNATSRVLLDEEGRFLRILAKGMRRLESEITKLHRAGQRTMPGSVAFHLHDAFGFPVETTREVLLDRGMALEEAGFDSLMHAQRERARAARGTTPIFGAPPRA